MEACPTGSIRHTQEFEGACNNPAGLVRHFVTEKVPLYKPKKGGETEPRMVQKVDIGLRYLDEVAEPEKCQFANQFRLHVAFASTEPLAP